MSHITIFSVYLLVLAMAWLMTVVVDKTIDHINRIPLNEVMLLSGPCWIFFMSEAVLGNIFYINLDKRLLNVAILIVLYKLLHLIFRRKPVGFAISSFGVVIYAIVSTFVVRSRNRPTPRSLRWQCPTCSTATSTRSTHRSARWRRR